MRYIIFLLSVISFQAHAACVSITTGDNFTALWQGVDFVDGGNSYRQILAYKNEQCETVYELRGRDTWHGPCGYGDPAPITGNLEKTGIYTIEGSWELDCQAPPTDITGDRSFLVEYEYFPFQKKLVETLINPATGLPINRVPIEFYK